MMPWGSRSSSPASLGGGGRRWSHVRQSPGLVGVVLIMFFLASEKGWGWEWTGCNALLHLSASSAVESHGSRTGRFYAWKRAVVVPLWLWFVESVK